MAAGDLTTLVSVEQFLSLPSGNSEEALLSALITAVSVGFAGYIGRQVLSQAFTERRDGKGTIAMPFKNPPATAVASVTIGVDLIPAGDAARTPGYYFSDTMLMLNGYRFCRGLGNVMLVYTGGFASVPSDLQEACNEQVALRYKERAHFDKSSEAIAGQTTAFVMKDMKPSTQAVLERYRRRFSA